ncbi:hypothetical protein CVU83_00035 [Candidatus Falkowbacteria bacterium HGW-Falkowbacteria-2]|uniref:Uncharacterized protein n=1 Tax=Candidatus Falkowbacteria bacterium HGW-Falkowbacteria-2 TaxID=2013769 RepID=A0A2N2E3W4_9BACT|nr:MAG: hypothetical protein CVU83_00035 [Candidatus Falkowbacteria bacterium HGW-Falkowbacteria-2]
MENNTSKHPQHVVGYDGSFKDLAEAIGTMSYDQVAVFLGELAANILEQAISDLKVRNRPKLAQHLFAAAGEIKKAQSEMDSAWKVCKPYMPKQS